MIPETQKSLIVRLADRHDSDAWFQFSNVYRSVIYSMARKHGLQDADADEVVQTVFSNISNALAQRPHDWARAKFRTWLFRVTFNAISNKFRSAKPDLGSGDTAVIGQLNRVPSPVELGDYDEAYEKAIFRWAAKQIRSEFQEETWNAFWMTAVMGRSCEDVARAIGKEIGSVYAARSRIIRRLRKKIKDFDESCQID